MSKSKLLALVLGLSFFLPAFATVQAASIRPAPIASGQSDVIDIRKRRYRRGAFIGAIIGGAIIGGAIARDRGYYHGRRYHRNRYYNRRHYRNHRRYGHRRYYRRGHAGHSGYDANGFVNER